MAWHGGKTNMVMGISIILDFIGIKRRKDNRRTFSEVLEMDCFSARLLLVCIRLYSESWIYKDAGAWTRELPMDRP